MNKASVRIYPEQVLHADFLGVGVNIIPVCLMANNRLQGYTDAHWEMDKKRILTMKPKVARVWFQVDWMEPTKGEYTWNSPEMKAFYKYMDVLQSAGTEVQLNFGWKIGRAVQEWFSIPGTEGRISAPRDLDAYAVSCSVLLQELIVGRGYANVKYLSFYNEPNGHWDFEAPGDQKAYYAEMLKRVNDRLVVDGRREWVQIWGPEEVDASGDWTHYMKNHADDCIDEYTFHIYGGSYEQFSEQIAIRRDYTAPKLVGMTEFGWSGDDESGWDSGFANYVVKAANEGIHSALVWQLNGVWCEDPDESVNTNGVYTLWDSLVLGMNPHKSYYAAGLLARYIPAHSSVVHTETDSDQVRTAVFASANGDMTIVVEYRGGEAMAYDIACPGLPPDLQWARHVYKGDVELEGNAILSPSTPIEVVDGVIHDSIIDECYQFVIYTTMKPQAQVEILPVQVEMISGDTMAFKANVIDATGGVIWSVDGDAASNGSISESGIYTAPRVSEDAWVAIHAESESDSDGRGVALIKVLANKESIA